MPFLGLALLAVWLIIGGLFIADTTVYYFVAAMITIGTLASIPVSYNPKHEA